MDYHHAYPFASTYDVLNGDIQSMIEDDMNSDFSDQLGSNNYSMVSSHDLSSSTSTYNFGIQTESSADISWMDQQTVNVNDIQGVVPPENTNLFFFTSKPQTVQPNSPPITTAEERDATCSSQVMSPKTSILEDSVINLTETSTPTIQFITSPVPGSSAISLTSQQQCVQPPTITYVATSSSNPSTLKNIQNNTHSSISSVTTYHQTMTQHLLSSNSNHHKLSKGRLFEEKQYPKPVYSYSCLIAMALKNSETGALPVSEIYSFMTENFPYFKIAPDGWKNSVRHNLSLNKCFEKIENPKATGNSRKGCLWGLNPAKIEKMEEEITKWRKKDPQSVKRSMARPDKLEMIEKGNIGSHSPHHPNNVKSGAGSSTRDALNSKMGAVQRLLQQQYQTSPASSSSSDASSSDAGSAPSTPTKLSPHHLIPHQQQQQQQHVSLIEIRPATGPAKSTVRTIKLEPPTTTLMSSSAVSQQQMLHHDAVRSSGISTVRTPPPPVIKGEFVTIKNEPDVVVKEEPDANDDDDEDDYDEVNEQEEEDMDQASPDLADLSFIKNEWDDLSNEGVVLGDNCSSSFFSFNSLTSSPATVQNITGVGA